MEIEENNALEGAADLIRENESNLRAFIISRMPDENLQEDILSAAKLAILRSWDRFDPQQPFQGWAIGIVKNVIADVLRKERRHRATCVQTDVAELLVLPTENNVARDELDARKEFLSGCLEQLPDRHRRLVHQFFFDDLSYQQISRKAGKTVGNLHVIFSRIRLTLGTCITRQMDSL